ncbi:hypothetical protein GA0070623_0942 [Micromonospora rifamycinica]|uniref:Uncharacterized protein n=1 Tax=Micromonospora rifamycinica TaxID=291594 RepID=A0A1C5HA16_9ACTN|nr:hypothetical protein GA0070623_0942 [Micromonospora rifamycinica]
MAAMATRLPLRKRPALPKPPPHPDQPRPLAQPGRPAMTPPDPTHYQVVWEEQIRQHEQGHLRNERPKARIERLI